MSITHIIIDSRLFLLEIHLIKIVQNRSRNISYLREDNLSNKEEAVGPKPTWGLHALSLKCLKNISYLREDNLSNKEEAVGPKPAWGLHALSLNCLKKISYLREDNLNNKEEAVGPKTAWGLHELSTVKGWRQHTQRRSLSLHTQLCLICSLFVNQCRIAEMKQGTF